jgi:hypothetical protein
MDWVVTVHQAGGVNTVLICPTRRLHYTMTTQTVLKAMSLPKAAVSEIHISTRTNL